MSAPTIGELIAGSDVFGQLAPDEQALLAQHFVVVTRDRDETLIREGEMFEAIFLLAAGTVEMTREDRADKHVVLRASPGDSIGMIGLITGTASVVTATALTPVVAYCLDKTTLTTVLRERPGMATSLEAQAKRGLAWLHCEVAAHENEQIEKPDMLLARFRQFLRRLNV